MKRLLHLTLFAALSSLQAPAPAPAAEEDIRPARPKVEIPVKEEFDPVPLIAGAITLAAIAAVWWWLRRRPAARRRSAPVERALESLSRIDRERNTLESGALADASAGAVRQFIAERFGIAAPRRTTEEFLRDLKSVPLPALAAHREKLVSFLSSCDLAKFAGADFNGAERLKLLEAAIDFVRLTHSTAQAAESQQQN